MAANVLITWTAEDVKGIIRQLPEKAVKRATVRSLNKVAGNVRTAAGRGIRSKRSLPAKTVRDAMRIRRATPAALRSSLVVTGRPIPLRDYRARQTRQGATVSVTPGARKLVSHEGNRGFILQEIGGHVFARERSTRLPIKKLYGPSLPATFMQKEVRLAWVATARDALVKRSREELSYELRKIQAR